MILLRVICKVAFATDLALWLPCSVSCLAPFTHTLNLCILIIYWEGIAQGSRKSMLSSKSAFVWNNIYQQKHYFSTNELFTHALGLERMCLYTFPLDHLTADKLFQLIKKRLFVCKSAFFLFCFFFTMQPEVYALIVHSTTKPEIALD